MTSYFKSTKQLDWCVRHQLNTENFAPTVIKTANLIISRYCFGENGIELF